MTEAAKRNLRRLLEHAQAAGDDGPAWSYGGPEFTLGRRPYARRLVLATIRHYGMTGGWYSTLTDPEIMGLEDLLGIGQTTVQKSLREEELAGRIVRISRVELTDWLGSIDRADLAEKLPRSKRFLVDLRPLSGLLGPGVRQTHPVESILARSHKATIAQLVVDPSAIAQGDGDDPSALGPVGEVPLACARASNLGFKDKGKGESLTPLNPPETIASPEVERLRHDWEHGDFAKKCVAIGRLIELGLEPLPPEEPASPSRILTPAPAEPFSTATKPNPKPNPKATPEMEVADFISESKRLVGLLAEPDTRADVVGRLTAMIDARFGVKDMAKLTSRLYWFAESEYARDRLSGLFAYAVTKAASPSGCFWGGITAITRESRYHDYHDEHGARKKPAPAPTRQSFAGTGPSQCV